MSEIDICLAQDGFRFFVDTYIPTVLDVMAAGHTMVLTSVSGVLEVWRWSLEDGLWCRLSDVVA